MLELRDSLPSTSIKLFNPDQEPPSTDGGGELSPESTLSQFFLRWYLPIIMIGERQNAAGTIENFIKAFDYWCHLTGEPPMRNIDDFTTIRFATGLRTVTYTRGRLGKPRLLEVGAQKKHISNILTVMGFAVEMGFVPRMPRLKSPRGKPKNTLPAFTMEQVKAIMQATLAMTEPQFPGIRPSAWWQAAICLLFFTGFRWGTIFPHVRQVKLFDERVDVQRHGLLWDRVQERVDGLWLSLRAEDVSKTAKAQDKALHADVIRSIRRIRQPSETVIPWMRSKTHFRHLHAELQQRAGIPADQCLAPHAWRRTHAVQVMASALHLLRKAQVELNHADLKVTLQSYVGDGNESSDIIRGLPSIIPEDNGQQLRLF